mgnify:CR=1 FL=1
MHDLPLITTIAVAFTAAWLLGLLTQRLRLSASFPSRLDSKESVELAVGALKEELLKLIDEGIVIIPE